MWVFENQFHPLVSLANLGGMDNHQYILDWLRRALIEESVNDARVAYVKESGDGPFGECEWTPPVRPGQAYY